MDRAESGRAVRNARDRMGLTQEQFAVRAGMTRVTLARVEAGERVQPRTLRAAMEAAGLEVPSTSLSVSTDAEVTAEFLRRFPGRRAAEKIAQILSDEPLPPPPPRQSNRSDGAAEGEPDRTA